jgi:phosphodiesterase/alkaline phosphatase D-like protein
VTSEDIHYATPAEDLAGYLTGYPQQLTFGDDEPADVMDRYHTPTFEMINDGIRLDRQRLLDHVATGRKNAVAVRVDVHEFVADRTRVAARYTLTATMRKGAVIATEIYMFGELAADGRLHRVCQATRTVPAA